MSTPTDAGRPVLRARVPDTLIEAVDTYARRTGVTRSEALRELVTSALRERGQWPPHASRAA